MTIENPKYIEQLMNARGNGLVKIVTGIRRCGKSFLLSTLFVDELKKPVVAVVRRVVAADLQSAAMEYKDLQSAVYL